MTSCIRHRLGDLALDIERNMKRYIIFAILFNGFVQFGCSINFTNHNASNVRLRRSGADGCQGLVQFYDPASNTLLQSCNSEAGDSEVKVICRQLGCTTDNARKVDPSSFGYSGAEYFTYFNYSCSGDELTLSSCDALSSINCTTSDLLSAVAADCGNGITSGVNEVSRPYAVIIIACSIVGGLLMIVAIVDVVIILCCVYKRRTESRFDLYIYN